MCDAIVRTAGMVNLQSLAEMTRLPIQGDNSKDCRPAFINAMDIAILQGNEGFHGFPFGAKQTKKPEGFAPSDKSLSGEHYLFGNVAPELSGAVEPVSIDGPLYTPFLHRTKADIAFRALELNVPLHMTWSCYKGGDKHCGRCGTCVERLEAIDEATLRYMADKGEDQTIQDMTEYEDVEFWKTQVRK